jgi:uncharacterized protein (DUF1697 family)
MNRYIALLRGINVSGQKLISMAELKEHFKLPGFQNVVTYIQSGNVLFDSKETDTAILREKIEKQLQKKLGYAVTVVLRSTEAIRHVVQNNPFTGSLEGRKLYVTFLASEPSKGAYDALKGYLNEYEEVQISGTEVYIITNGYGDTKLSNTLIEKKLGIPATTRNWNTVNKVLAL